LASSLFGGIIRVKYRSISRKYRHMPLTDVAVRNAKPRDQAYKLADSGGLYLYVATSGGRLWRMDYRHESKRQTLSIGRYPITGLSDARAKRDEAKRQLAAGINPARARKEQKDKVRASGLDTFEAIAREWYDLQKSTWVPRHAEDVIHSLERDVFPTIGDVPIREITAPQVLKLLRSIEGRPAIETARRIRQRISAVFVYAIASGRGETDPAAIVQKAMAPQKKGRQPAITDLEGAREMLRRAEATPASPVTKLALRLLALTAVRPGTLITTPWSEFVDIDAQEPMWTVPAERMKMRLHFKSDEARDHLVPLSPQALATIDVLRKSTGGGPLVFPNGRHAHKPMSENAIGYLLNRAGYHHRHVPHGWRATFSSVMNERFPADSRVIDLMLAHTPKDRVEGAYNRAAHLRRRGELAQSWADLLLDGFAAPDALLKGPRRGSL
jgi:integrase